MFEVLMVLVSVFVGATGALLIYAILKVGSETPAMVPLPLEKQGAARDLTSNHPGR